MGRKAPAPLRRRGPVRPERYIMALFCEGAATEPEYLQALSQLPGDQKGTAVQLRIDLTGAVPLTLVREAARAKAEGSANEYWCVFDVEWPDQHPNLLAAVSLAQENDILLAISNPAFEIWLVLHHKDHRAHMDTNEAIHERRRLDGSADKHLDPGKYMPQRAVAAGRAQALRKMHAGNASNLPHDNPSTNVDELVAAIEKSRP